MNPLLIGLRNLRRNRRRTFITALSITCGFIAIALFAGYTKTVYRSLADQAIHGELLGHLTVAKQGFRKSGALEPGKYLLAADDIARAEAVVQRVLPGSYVAPRLAVNGLISNGKASTIFIAEGLTPGDMQHLRGPRARASGGLDEKLPNGITVSRGLAQMLGLKDGSDASVLVSTAQGQANALDVNVTDTFSTGNAGTDNKSVFLPMALARSLFDVEGKADRLTILLPDATQAEAAAPLLGAAFQASGLSLEVDSWQNLSAFYLQVKGLFDMVFAFLLAIVLAIIVMSVANAMTMSVIERTREIGTMRALGMRRNQVVRLFLSESVILVVMACIAGTVAALALRYAINFAGFTYRPPNSTDEVPLLIGFDILRSAMAGVALCVLGALAAYWPARRAAAQPITLSLTHI